MKSCPIAIRFFFIAEEISVKRKISKERFPGVAACKFNLMDRLREVENPNAERRRSYDDPGPQIPRYGVGNLRRIGVNFEDPKYITIFYLNCGRQDVGSLSVD